MTSADNQDIRRSRTTPGRADIRLVIAGTIGVVAGLVVVLVRDPPPPHLTPGPLVYLAGLLSIVAVLVALLALPAYVFRGRRGDWRGFTVWIGKGLLVLTGLLAVGLARDFLRERPSARIESLKSGDMTISAFMRAERAANPARFDAQILDVHERILKRSFPGLRNVALSGVIASNAWMRTHATFATAPGVPNDSVSTKGHLVIYYHPAGMAVLAAACSAEDEDCQPLGGLLTTADDALRTRLASSDVEGVLPDSGSCSTQAVPTPNRDRQTTVRVCAYPPVIQLTFGRIERTETIDSLVSMRTQRQ